MSRHAQFHYSVTVETDDEAVLHCLRALSQDAQATENKRIPWGGTKKQDWERNKHCVKFHFSKPDYRKTFTREAERLLPTDLWKKVAESDSDPAMPQS